MVQNHYFLPLLGENSKLLAGSWINSRTGWLDCLSTGAPVVPKTQIDVKYFLGSKSIINHFWKDINEKKFCYPNWHFLPLFDWIPWVFCFSSYCDIFSTTKKHQVFNSGYHESKFTISNQIFLWLESSRWLTPCLNKRWRLGRWWLNRWVRKALSRWALSSQYLYIFWLH